MDVYYIKERLACTQEEKAACMPLVKFIHKLWKIAIRDGLLVFLEELQASSFYDEIPFLQVAVPLFDGRCEGDTVRKVLESYIVLNDMRGKELLEALIILEGLCGIAEERNKGVLMETICSYFGLAFRKQFYQFIKPSFLDENCF